METFIVQLALVIGLAVLFALTVGFAYVVIEALTHPFRPHISRNDVNERAWAEHSHYNSNLNGTASYLGWSASAFPVEQARVFLKKAKSKRRKKAA